MGLLVFPRVWDDKDTFKYLVSVVYRDTIIQRYNRNTSTLPDYPIKKLWNYSLH